MTTRVDLGARRSVVNMFNIGYSVTTIQQLLKGKDGICSYEKEPVLPDKQFRIQLLGAYTCNS